MKYKAPKYLAPITDRSVILRILLKVTISVEGCWEWNGYTDRDGYGHVKVDGKDAMAHRITWAIFNGEIPEGLTIHHTCRNRKCVRHDHLELMTQSENTREASRRYWDARNKSEKCPSGISKGD